MRIGAEGKLDGRQCFSVPNEEKGERRKEKRGEGVRERARRCEGNIWERERFDHVDAADSWAKEGDAKRLHNRPCGRSLGEGRPGRKWLAFHPRGREKGRGAVRSPAGGLRAGGSHWGGGAADPKERLLSRATPIDKRVKGVKRGQGGVQQGPDTLQGGGGL